MNRLVFAAISVLCITDAVWAKGPWGYIVCDDNSTAMQYAVTDLQRYIGQVSGKVPVVINSEQWTKKPVDAMAVGTVSRGGVLANFAIDANAIGEQGYYIGEQKIKGVRIIAAAGAGQEGAVNAVYGLLKEAGFGFYLGSEAVPERLPEVVCTKPIVRKPALKIRGVLPWYNFFNSPTTWDMVDHRAFVDQLIRSGANFIGFHTYDSEPFAAYEQNGRMVWGGRLLNTKSPTWGTHPMPIEKFRFGLDKVFGEDYFGAATTFLTADDSNVIKIEQNVMRDALAYAKARGLKTCIGFEINGDPTKTQDRDVFLKRINHVLEQYPAADFIWIWQMETQGAQGYWTKYNLHQLRDKLDPNSELVKLGQQHRDVFKRIVDEASGEKPFFQNTEDGKAARAIEGARLEVFGNLAYEAIKAKGKGTRLVISGWGGDERLCSAEYYDGLDKLLPKDVAFASLDHITPRGRVDRIYGQLSSDRERWPIPWLECDGDEWQPQPLVNLYEKMMADVVKGGSQGLLGIHWRTRDIEENFGYMMDYAWNPGLSAKEYFVQLASRCYPKKIAGEMSQVHNELDMLGYRWVGGGGQNECALFTWGPGDDAKAVKLQQIRDTVASLRRECGASKVRIDWLLARIDFTLSYHRAENAASKVQSLLDEAAKADHSRAVELALDAAKTLDTNLLVEAMRTYVRRVSTRGEYGVLATMSTKAVVSWEELEGKIKAILKEQYKPQEKHWIPERQIILPRLIASTQIGSEIVIEPIVLGGVRAWMHYRPIGGKWKTIELQTKRGWVMKGTIPAQAVLCPAIEVELSFDEKPARKSEHKIVITVFGHTLK